MAVNLSEIDIIYFGISSPEEIKNHAVCKIDNTKTSNGIGTVYDERMGASIDNSKPCVTCGLNVNKCTGHFGYIELNQYIINPLFYKQVYQYLSCMCLNPECYRLLINNDQIMLYKLNKCTGSSRFEKILEKLDKVGLCCHCGHVKPTLNYSPTDNIISMTHAKSKDEETGEKSSMTVVIETDEIKKVFDNITDEDVKTLGLDVNYVHPKNFIMSVFPVAPPSIRPYVYTDGQICDDDLTIQYIEIIKSNNILASEDIDEKVMQNALKKLKFCISTLMNNTRCKAKHSQSNRALKGIAERIQGKDELIRGHLMGKRVDFSARTPIGPEPNLKIDQLGIPYEVAEILTIPERVNSYNINKLTEIVNSGKANFITKNNGAQINLKFALYKQGTSLLHGDVVIRGDYRININMTTLSQNKFKLKKGDLIERNGVILKDIQYPEFRPYKLEIGNIVHRQLRNDDFILLNRQPTLHAGSMMAMKAVILPGKTFRFNLAACASFNADFDKLNFNNDSI